MQKEVDPRIVIAVIAVAVIVLGVLLWRQFGTSAATGAAVSPQQAGLGRPMYPPGQGAAPGGLPPGGSPPGR